jgi:hypothetical protein
MLRQLPQGDDIVRVEVGAVVRMHPDRRIYFFVAIGQRQHVAARVHRDPRADDPPDASLKGPLDD